MTGPLDVLERSLRDGPPDEAGYRAQPPIATDQIAPIGGGQAAPVGHVKRRPSSRIAGSASRWQYALALLVVVGLAAGGIGFASRRVAVGSDSTATPTFAPLTETFTSPRNGFSVRYPAGWTIRPATARWPRNFFLPLGNPALDELTHAGEARLVIASQSLAPGQTADDWLAAYFHPYEGARPCDGDRSAWPRLPVSGSTGYLDADGCPASDRDVWFDLIASSGDRVYQIRLYGNVDLAYFKAVLAAITLDPAAAVD